jgi:hypothetical protein
MNDTSSLIPVARLDRWLDGFVGSEEERTVADALVDLALAAERIADPRLHPKNAHGPGEMSTWMNAVASMALSGLRDALERAE